MSAQPAELEQRLSTLAQAGAAAWDEPGVQLVRRLLCRAQQADAALGGYLLGRAAQHLNRLANAFEASRAEAQAELSHLVQLGVADRARLQAKLDEGALGEVRRLARRHRGGPRRTDPSGPARQLDLEARATARGITSPGTLAPPSAELLAATLYRDALAGASASLAVARAAASVADDAGHYNPERVASRALEVLSEHPAYLRAQLARLEVVSLLTELGGAKKKPDKRARRR